MQPSPNSMPFSSNPKEYYNCPRPKYMPQNQMFASRSRICKRQTRENRIGLGVQNALCTTATTNRTRIHVILPHFLLIWSLPPLSALLLHFPRFINQQLEARGFKDFQFQHCHTHTHTHNLQLRPSEKETCEVTKAENPSHMSK